MSSTKVPVLDAVALKRPRGRPTKEQAALWKEQQKLIKNQKKPMGRPKELGTKVQELKERLLFSEDSSRIVNKVISKALNDDDPNQMVALKLCLDRILPVSAFEKAKNEGARIEINISSFDAPEIKTISDNTIDMESSS